MERKFRYGTLKPVNTLAENLTHSRYSRDKPDLCRRYIQIPSFKLTQWTVNPFHSFSYRLPNNWVITNLPMIESCSNLCIPVMKLALLLLSGSRHWLSPFSRSDKSFHFCVHFSRHHFFFANNGCFLAFLFDSVIVALKNTCFLRNFKMRAPGKN